MTEAEKKAIRVMMETNDLESFEDAESTLANLHAAGLQVVERPGPGFRYERNQDYEQHPAFEVVRQAMQDDDGPANLLCNLDAYGWDVVRRPQRKPLPDADGYWWIKTSDGTIRPRRSYRYAGVQFVIGAHVSDIEWAEGPIEGPE